ncbi:MAG TPA: YhjD/YihY/BrkB family envelope integrity protein [Polyangiaceae bacterium]|nr:YhjD/YihY/BrkB family envelope integrity protein [Polyangiaceae bacterium]
MSSPAGESRPRDVSPLPLETPFDVPLAPRVLNDALSAYFSRSPRRRRLYAMLLSLLRLHELRAANSIAFDLFLALVPMLALAGWVVTSALDDSEALISGSLLLGVTPHEFRDFIHDNLMTLQGSQLAPWATLAGWWLSSSAFFSLIAVFEDSFPCEPRPYWQITLLSLGFALLGFSLLVGAGASGLLLSVDTFSDLQNLFERIAASGLLRFALALAAYFCASFYLAFVYRFAIRRRTRRRVWPGAFLAAAIGSAASLAFGAYATHIASYALFYGGLAAVTIVLLWLWLWCTAILIGAEVNVTLEDLAALDAAAKGPTSADTDSADASADASADESIALGDAAASPGAGPEAPITKE